MKSLIIILAMATSINVMASGVTKAEANKALEIIDNQCADTWCEGDYNYEFKSLKCSKGSCELSFKMIDSGANGDKEIYSSAKTCKLNDIKSAKDINSGIFLADKFNEQVDQCLSNTKF